MSVVFWDFDGTLATSNDHWAFSGTEALHDKAPEWNIDPKAFGKQLRSEKDGVGIPWRCPYEDHTAHTYEGFWQVMNDWYARCYMHFGVPESIARAAACDIRKYLARPENYILYPDTAAALNAVKELGHINVLISNNYPELDAVMEKLGILSCFEGVVISGQVGYDKPRGEIFALAKSRFPAERYYMVGDNPVADMLGAKNSGIKAVLVHKGVHENADVCFDDLASVADMLRSE